MAALDGKVAVVTGASRGIGRAIARVFAQHGATVCGLARSAEDLASLAREIDQLGGRALVFETDVSRASSVEHAVSAIEAELGQVDLLVNNAGAVIRRAFAELSADDWHHVLGANLDSVFFMTRALIPSLVASRGRIINIASIAGRQGTPMLSAYCAAKHGVIGLTRALAEELRGAGVSVNAICPGSVDTQMLREGLPGAEPAMSPEDIAETALFLATKAPDALTGSCVDVFG